MPANKRQHYVPRFILKRFSSNSAARTISLINLQRGLVVNGASLRDQCYKDYFYSSQQVEKSLANLEGKWAIFLDKLIKEESIDRDKIVMLAELFCVQRTRTLRAEAETNEIFNNLAKSLVAGKFAPVELAKVKMKLDNASLLNLMNGLSSVPILFDMKAILLKNATRIPFIIGDNPVVSTNWFCRTRFPSKAGIGLASSGLQMVLPISPKYCLMLHDPKTYSMPDLTGHTTISSERDVRLLNKLQVSQAHQNIYFSTGTPVAFLDWCIGYSRPNPTLTHFQRFQATEDPGTYVSTAKSEIDPPDVRRRQELLVTSMQIPETDIRLHNLTIRKRTKPREIDSASEPIRDPAWVQIVMDYSKVRRNGDPDSGFLEHIRSHPAIGRVSSNIRSVIFVNKGGKP
jgi:hypothetical protein